MWTGSHLKTYVLRMFLEHQKVNHFPRFVLHCTKYIGEPPLALMWPFDVRVTHSVVCMWWIANSLQWARPRDPKSEVRRAKSRSGVLGFWSIFGLQKSCQNAHYLRPNIASHYCTYCCYYATGSIGSAFRLQCFSLSVPWLCWLGSRKGIWPVKNWVVRCWHGYLSGARCRHAYCPADATVTHCLLLQ